MGVVIDCLLAQHMSGPVKKEYGLIVKGTATTSAPVARPSIFGDDDDDDGKVDVCGIKQSASTMRVLKAAEREQERARAVDPDIFNYDKAYEEIQSVKNEKVAAQKELDKERKSKYAEDIIKAHKRRELEKNSREERKQLKEREAEGDEFADKEVFVTKAYREQMEEVEKFRQEEAYEARFNNATAVEKQKMWEAGFARNLLNDLARDGTVPKPKPAEEAPKLETKAKKQHNVRRRLDSRSPSPEKEQEKEQNPKKSIYSDDEDDDAPAFKPPQKNFSGELQPGLNKVTKKVERPAGKVLTKAEKLAQAFTPPSSDDEGERGGRRGDRREKREDGREKERKEREEREKEEKRQKEADEARKKKKLVRDPKEVRAERMEKIKAILAPRNGPDQIAAMRERYFERRDSGFVVPPT